MRVIDFIEERRDGFVHSAEDIAEFVLGFTRGEIPDYQVSAWLMAVVLRGLSDSETLALTDAMIASGERLDLSGIPGIKLDKHSTGGVGDKVTLAVVPLLAAAGIPVAKLSGRGLGFTGGTIDKLESIPGFRVRLSQREIVEIVSKINACICSQTPNLTPADGKLYALRDVTGTVESIPLIASSIMSKKVASGADVVILDVKVGRAAFMKELSQAEELARTMVRIGDRRGIKTSVTLTRMDTPLGRAVGNWLEVREAASLLKNEPSDSDFREETLYFVAKGLMLAGSNLDAARLLESGAGYEKLLEILVAQGAAPDALGQERLAPIVQTVSSDRAGFVSDIDALAIGKAAMALGAGRRDLRDSIDPLAGIEILAPVGSPVVVGSPIARLHSSKTGECEKNRDAVLQSFTIEQECSAAMKRIIKSY